jgi:hypothetical protein
MTSELYDEDDDPPTIRRASGTHPVAPPALLSLLEHGFGDESTTAVDLTAPVDGALDVLDLVASTAPPDLDDDATPPVRFDTAKALRQAELDRARR